MTAPCSTTSPGPYGRRWRRPALVTLCFLAASALLASGVQADSGAPNYGIPPFHKIVDPRPNESEFTAVRTTVARADQAVTLTNLKVLTYANFCLRIDLGYGLLLQTCCPDPFDTTGCPANQVVDAPMFDDALENSGSISWVQVRGPSWVESPQNASTRYGTFAPMHIRTVGFGSIPVEATAYISQPIAPDGYREPMELYYSTESTPIPAGSELNGWGQAPNGAHTFFALPAEVTGHVDIRISDVTVDGVPMNVGPNCHTATPGKLNISQGGGFYDGDSDPSDRTINPLGTPGAWRPLGAGDTTVPGSVQIPAFAGCRQGNEDLDSLLTGLVSGEHNTVIATQHDAIEVCGAQCPSYPTEDVAAIASRHVATRPSDLASKTPAKLTREITDLTPQQLRNAARVIHRLPARIRTQVLTTLPPELVQAIEH